MDSSTSEVNEGPRTFSPRIEEISFADRISVKPFIVAATIESGLLEPSDLDKTFLTPAPSRTARTPPPAMMPVPLRAGLSKPCLHQN